MTQTANHSTLNIDHAEVKKFEDLAHRWWDPQSEFKPLHDINPLRANYIDERSPVAGKTILDVGCGGGLLSEALAFRGGIVTGIDAGEVPIKVAKLHLLESGAQVHYRQITAEEIVKEKPASFDIVTCLEMLEHVPNPSSVIAACAALCKPGGHLYFSTINRNPKAYLFAILGAEYVLNLLPKGTHDFEKFIKPSELSHWMRSSDIELRDIIGMTYNPISKKYRLDPADVDVNYLVHGLKIPG